MPIAQEKTYWVYIAASKPHGVLYVGITSDLAGRTWEHRERVIDGFTKRYWVGRLVYFEAHDDAATAAKRERLENPIDREKQPDVARFFWRRRAGRRVRVVSGALQPEW